MIRLLFKGSEYFFDTIEELEDFLLKKLEENEKQKTNKE